MTWNYRVLAFPYKEEVVFQICEVYYNEKGEPKSYVKDKSLSTTEGIKGLKWIIERHKEAIKKPILFGDDKFPLEYKK